MIKQKRSYEKSVNIILNDDFKEDIILMHYEDIEGFQQGNTASSRKISMPTRKPTLGSGAFSMEQPGGVSSMKRMNNRNNIFDEESMDLGSLPNNQPVSNRNLGDRKKSIHVVKAEMAAKDQANKKKAKGNHHQTKTRTRASRTSSKRASKSTSIQKSSSGCASSS